MILPKRFYQDLYVKERLLEYCGSQSIDAETFSTEYLSGTGELFVVDRMSEDYFLSATRDSFNWLLEQGVDLFRSVWDKTYTLGVLDIEYFNRIFPAEAYFNPHRVFNIMEPLYNHINNILKRFGIEVITIMTGRGYHFSFQVNFSNNANRQLLRLGKPEKSLVAKYKNFTGDSKKPVPDYVGLAYDGMGRLMEYLCYLILKEIDGYYNNIPIVCTDLSCDNSYEAIALDLSMYGDPIYMRDIRCPFSTYQKHRYMSAKFGQKAADIPIFITSPRTSDISVEEILNIRSNFNSSQSYASQVKTLIPESSNGVERLIRSYRSSRLYKFHKYYDSSEHDDPSIWRWTYDQFDISTLPPCVAHCLRYPNDNLLKPTNIQTLTRVLLKLGWHPKHISGLIRSKYERDYGWGIQWFRYDAATRANFYVRLFAGLIATGIDKEEDLNCESHFKKGYCLSRNCGFNLLDYRIF